MFPYNDKTNTMDIYLLGYHRLLSYDYQKKLVDKIIERHELLEAKLDLYLAGTEKFGAAERRYVLDLYLAGTECEFNKSLPDTIPQNILFSYEFGKRLKLENIVKGNFPKIFVDSGAYSMWTKGAQVNVDEYIKWLNDRADYIDLCGQVDAIPGTKEGGASYNEVREAAQKTWENYLYMRERMLRPESLLYTFHVGEPREFLKQALEWTDNHGNRIPYIALGGMVGKTALVRRNFLEMCFNIISNSSNPDVKVHAFGMTSMDLLSEFPIASCDSTSWIMVGANGNILTDVGTVSVSVNQSHMPNHFSHLPAEQRAEFEKEIAEFGFTLEELSLERNARILHNARYMKDRISKIKYRKSGRKFLF